MDQEKIYTIAFSHINGIGIARFRRIAAAFSSLYEAWNSPISAFAKTGIDKKTIDHIFQQRELINIENILARLERENVSVVIETDDAYPELLRKIYDPPFILFYRGCLPQKDRILFGIVGARKATPYGLQCTHQLVPDLVRHEIGIVSGLAYGIDGASHEATLANNGYTIAVVAGGVDQASIYPSAHKKLAERIVASKGCVISEYPPGTQPRAQQFPLRNRIIAGMARGILVVEAAEKSGALITASCALEAGREVLAVPGQITSPFSRGVNTLLKSGAHLVTEASDILSLLGFDLSQNARTSVSAVALTANEKMIYDFLCSEPMHLDQLISATKLDTQVVASTLLMLEIKNLIRSYGGMQYGHA